MVKILITGSADGLGLLAAQKLVEHNHTVYLHARNAKRAADARDACPGAAGVFVANLSVAAEVHKLAEDVKAVGELDTIIHNAGVASGREVTDMGIPTLFTVNLLAPYMLACLLQVPRRLIFVASELHQQADTSLEDIFWLSRGEVGFEDFPAYCDSKLHVILLANAVARRLKGVSVISVHPGWVATKLGGDDAIDKLEDGVATYVGLAEGNYDPNLTGKYFKPGMYLGQSSAASQDVCLQEKVVKACEDVCGLKLAELHK